MNDLDFLVKQMMLHHPSLFPSRISVLQHLYTLSGTGLQWSDDGKIVDKLDQGKPPVEHIDLSSIDRHTQTMMETFKRIDSRIHEEHPNDHLPDSLKAEHAKLLEQAETKRAQYIDRERNIDALASTPDTTTRIQETANSADFHLDPPPGVCWGYHTAKGILDGDGLLKTMPEVATEDFFNGGLEVLDAVIRGESDETVHSQLKAYRAELVKRRQEVQ